MGKRIIKKKAIVRSSSIQKTVEEGKQFVKSSTRIIKKRQKENQKRKAQQERRAAALAARRIRPAKAPKRVKRPRKILGITAPVASRSGVAPNVIRTGSRASNAGVARTSSKNNQLIEQELHDRLTKHGAKIGKLNFSLRWWDPNDLDLHLTCPCGTHIYFGNKKCTTCGGELDIDMNVGSNMSLEPVEHIFFKNAPKGLYKFWVNYYYGPKQFGGVKGGEKSTYALSLHEDYNQIFRYEDKVSNAQRQIHYDYAV